MTLEQRYHPSHEQRALAETFNAALHALLAPQHLPRAPEESGEVWAQLRSLGLFGVAVAEADGGSGLGAAEEVLIGMELGRSLATPSVLASLGAGHAAPAAAGRRTAAAYRHGERIVLVEDRQAERVLLRDGERTALYDNGFATQPLDRELWLASLRCGGALPEPIAHFDEGARLRLTLLDAAALSGIAEAAVRMAVDYAGQRRQFGRPIGMFQAVKHHCANMAMASRSAQDQTSFAAIAIDDGRIDAALQVDCALLVAGNAALKNAGLNIQIHGGIGFSEEADPHLLLKRAQVLIALAGGLEAATSRIADAGAVCC